MCIVYFVTATGMVTDIDVGPRYSYSISVVTAMDSVELSTLILIVYEHPWG